MNGKKAPDGYLEGFIRMDGDKIDHNEFFIWMYIPMKYLRPILEEFKDYLVVL